MAKKIYKDGRQNQGFKWKEAKKMASLAGSIDINGSGKIEVNDPIICNETVELKGEMSTASTADIRCGRDVYVGDELVISAANKIVDNDGNPIQFGGAGHTVTFKYYGENDFSVEGYDANGEYLFRYLNDVQDTATFNNCVVFSADNGHIITDQVTIYVDNVEHELDIDYFGDDDPDEGYKHEVSSDSYFFPVFGNVHIKI